MTKYGLRARVLAFTILPTLIIGGLIAGYFTFHRYHQLENNLIDQGINLNSSAKSIPFQVYDNTTPPTMGAFNPAAWAALAMVQASTR